MGGARDADDVFCGSCGAAMTMSVDCAGEIGTSGMMRLFCSGAPADVGTTTRGVDTFARGWEDWGVAGVTWTTGMMGPVGMVGGADVDRGADVEDNVEVEVDADADADADGTTGEPLALAGFLGDKPMSSKAILLTAFRSHGPIRFNVF